MLKDRQHQLHELVITVLRTSKMNGKLIELGSLRTRLNTDAGYVVSSYANPWEWYAGYEDAVKRYCQLIKEA